jgi:hypothetical protein
MERKNKKVDVITPEKLLEMFKELFDEQGISGILYLPKIGTVTILSDENGRRAVLEQCRREIVTFEELIKKEAELETLNFIQSQISNKKQKSKEVNYCG